TNYISTRLRRDVDAVRDAWPGRAVAERTKIDVSTFFSLWTGNMAQAVGLVGWRGMVGSVLMQRMRDEDDFSLFEPVFFSTSNAGGAAPQWADGAPALVDAYDIEALRKLPIILTAQGGDYTSAVYPKLRAAGWDGLWIDAASTLRMQDDAVIVLDPVNRAVIDEAMRRGIRNFVGGNCTVS